MTLETLTVVLASGLVGSLTLFLVWINWKILDISCRILEVSVELLAETVIIRVETIKIRDVSEKVLKETIRMRKALGDVEPQEKKRIKRSFKKQSASRPFL